MLNSFLGIGRVLENATLQSDRESNPSCRFDLTMEQADLVPCLVIDSNRALTLHPYLTKGCLIGVSGNLRTESGRWWIQVNEVNFLFLRRPQNGAEPDES